MIVPNDVDVETLPTTCRAVADRAAVPEVDRRPRLQPGAPAARALRLRAARSAPPARCWSTAAAAAAHRLRRGRCCAPTRRVDAAQRALRLLRRPLPGRRATKPRRCSRRRRSARTRCRQRDRPLRTRSTPRPLRERVAHAVAMLQRRPATRGRIVLATSLGAEDMVLTDLIARHALPIAIVTLDTGKLHARDLALIAAHRAALRPADRGLHRPRSEAVVALRAPRTATTRCTTAIELRKACCAHPQARAAGAHAGRPQRLGHRPAPRAVGRRAARSPFAERRRRTAASSSTRWPTGRWDDVWHYIARNDVPYNPLHDQFYPEHRLRTVHPRDRRRRGLPRRPLVVGGRDAPRSAACTCSRRRRSRCRPSHATLRSCRMNARVELEQLLPQLDHTPPRLARGRSDPHPARSRGRVRAPGAAVLRRQGFVRGAAPGREGVQAPGTAVHGRLPFPLLHVDTGHNFPEVIEFRDRRVAETGRAADRAAPSKTRSSAARVRLRAPARIAQRPPDR